MSKACYVGVSGTARKVKKIYVGGDRADDLMQRLLKAGASEEIMEKVTDYQVLVNRLKEEDRPAFLLPNYASMM